MGDDPDILVPLTSARTEFEASTIAAALRHEGIPSEVFATAAATLQWETAMTNPIRVMVRRKDLEAAGGILRAIKADSIDIDWDEVDVGELESSSETSLGPRRTRIGGFTKPMVFVRRIGGVLLILAALTWFVPLVVCALTLGAVLLIGGLRAIVRDRKRIAGGVRR